MKNFPLKNAQKAPKKDARAVFSKRLHIYVAGLFMAFLGLMGRLIFLQVVNQEKYALLSDKNRIHTVYTLPKRGRILDRNGSVLATTHMEYQAAIDLNQFRLSPQHWAEVCQRLGLDASIPFSFYQEKHIKVAGPSSTIPLKNGLSWEEIRSIESPAHQIPGLVVLPQFLRTYPYGEVFSHVVGYVKAPREEDIRNNANLKLLGAMLGATGVEKAADARLQGTPGFKRYEVNAKRRIVRVLEEVPPIHGGDLRLTLHAGLQQRIHGLMKNVRCGVAMVLDVQTGELLASVSVPGFDPNVFSNGLTPQIWQALANDRDCPLLHRAIAGAYAPGSTFKMVVALAALEEKVSTPQTVLTCPGFIQVGTQKMHCWRWRIGGHGPVDLRQAIAQSCDVYFFQLASRLGMASMINQAKHFGLGEKSGIELPGEQRGHLPPAPSVWRKQDLGAALNLSIGQGSLTATPLQLLVMTARIASGRAIQPHLMADASPKEFPKLPLSDASLSHVRKGMEEVVWGEYGSAHMAQLPNLRIAGKTGTSQVYRITAEERRRGRLDERPYHLRDHALFVGYAPASSPKFAVVVVVEHGESGSRTAAPLGRDVLAAAQELCGEQPEGKPTSTESPSASGSSLPEASLAGSSN